MVFIHSRSKKINGKFLKSTLTILDKNWHFENLLCCKLHTDQPCRNYMHIEYFRCKTSKWGKWNLQSLHFILIYCVHIYFKWFIPSDASTPSWWRSLSFQINWMVFIWWESPSWNSYGSNLTQIFVTHFLVVLQKFSREIETVIIRL